MFPPGQKPFLNQRLPITVKFKTGVCAGPRFASQINKMKDWVIKVIMLAVLLGFIYIVVSARDFPAENINLKTGTDDLSYLFLFNF